jgi:hypothetical protein
MYLRSDLMSPKQSHRARSLEFAVLELLLRDTSHSWTTGAVAEHLDVPSAHARRAVERLRHGRRITPACCGDGWRLHTTEYAAELLAEWSTDFPAVMLVFLPESLPERPDLPLHTCPAFLADAIIADAQARDPLITGARRLPMTHVPLDYASFMFSGSAAQVVALRAHESYCVVDPAGDANAGCGLAKHYRIRVHPVCAPTVGLRDARATSALPVTRHDLAEGPRTFLVPCVTFHVHNAGSVLATLPEACLPAVVSWLTGLVEAPIT